MCKGACVFVILGSTPFLIKPYQWMCFVPCALPHLLFQTPSASASGSLFFCSGWGCSVCVLGRFVLRLIIAFVFLSKYRARCRQRPRRRHRRRRRRSWRQDKPKEHVFLSSGSTTATTTTTTTRRIIVVVVVESSWKYLDGRMIWNMPPCKLTLA